MLLKEVMKIRVQGRHRRHLDLVHGCLIVFNLFSYKNDCFRNDLLSFFRSQFFNYFSFLCHFDYFAVTADNRVLALVVVRKVV